MPSLTQLLTGHGRLLVLDASSTRVQVGLLRADDPACWRSADDEAGTGIFTGTKALLGEAGLKLADIGAFVFCEGPGSMLGTRTVAMALRTWQLLRPWSPSAPPQAGKPRPAFAYQSLAVAGRFAWTQAPRSFAVIADARRDTWHVQAIGTDGTLTPLQRVAAGDLPAGELLTPENFRAWAQPPRPAASCCYDLTRIFAAISGDSLFRPVEAPDAFQHEAPAYKKWSAQVHSMATVPVK